METLTAEKEASLVLNHEIEALNHRNQVAKINEHKLTSLA